MKRVFIGLACALGVTTIVAAQSGGTTAPQEPQKLPDVTLTGCLTQGSGPTVFLFENAKADPRSTDEKARSFVVVQGTEDLNLLRHLNHEVTLVGAAEQKVAPVPPPGEKVMEKDLPKFTAKSLTMVSETCTAAH